MRARVLPVNSCAASGFMSARAPATICVSAKRADVVDADVVAAARAMNGRGLAEDAHAALLAL